MAFVKSSPILFVGMHESGCEVLASVLGKIGVKIKLQKRRMDVEDFGWRDPDLSEIYEHILLRQFKTSGAALAHWGWGESYNFDESLLPCEDSIKLSNYLQLRRSDAISDGPWGWCDPRSSLFLNQWQSLIHDIRVVAVYREPWETSNILKQRYPEQFLARPDWALKVWRFYNDKILAFKSSYPDQCLLIHASALEKNLCFLSDWLDRLVSRGALLSRLKIELAGLPVSAYGTWSYRHLYAHVYRDLIHTWEHLEGRADIPAVNQSSTELSPFLKLNKQGKDAQVAIIVPTYNHGDFLVDCIASIEKACADVDVGIVELVVVNDGSTDARTLGILGGLRAAGYAVIDSPNLGLSAARNLGLQHVKAPFILPLDDDNLLLPGYISSALPLMQQNPGLAAVYGDRDDFGLIVQHFAPGPPSLFELWRMNRIDACALIRKSWIEQCGGYDLTLAAFEDWDLWLGILTRGGELFYLPQICFAYCHRPGSMVRKLFESPTTVESLVVKLRKKHLNRFLQLACK